MAWSTAEVLRWLDQVEPRADGRSHFEWLELGPTASSAAIQGAFHAIARTRHPDLFRTALTGGDYDRLVRMYARVAAAYAELRTPEGAANYLRQRRDSGVPFTAPGAAEPPPAPPSAPAAAAIDPARAMNPRALGLYRRAERALAAGDRTTAVLNIKLAIAADPTSALLRGALAELTGG